MKMKITNPITGSKMDTSMWGILGLLAGGTLLWGVAATSQNFGRKLTSLSKGKLDFEPDPIRKDEVKTVDATMYFG